MPPRTGTTNFTADFVQFYAENFNTSAIVAGTLINITVIVPETIAGVNQHYVEVGLCVGGNTTDFIVTVLDSGYMNRFNHFAWNGRIFVPSDARLYLNSRSGVAGTFRITALFEKEHSEASEANSGTV